MTASTTLVVLEPFDTYTQGQTISDAATIAAILGGPHASYVVATFAPIVTNPGSGVPTIAVGNDYSWNAPPVPTGNPLTFAPINPHRQRLLINNATDQPIVLVFDDGNGGALSTYPLDPGAGAGRQGGDWDSVFFRGRVRIYQPSGLVPSGFIYVHED